MTEKKNNNTEKQAAIQKVSNHVDFEEMRKAMKDEFGIDIDDVDTRIKLRRLSKPEKKETKDEIHSWTKPSSTASVSSETPEQYRRRMSQGDKGFLGGLMAAAGIWILSKVGEKPKSQEPQPQLTAEEEFNIVERRLMRDNYLRYLNNRE